MEPVFVPLVQAISEELFEQLIKERFPGYLGQMEDICSEYYRFCLILGY